MKTEGDKKMAKDDVLIKKTLSLQKLLIYIISIAVLNPVNSKGLLSACITQQPLILRKNLS